MYSNTQNFTNKIYSFFSRWIFLINHKDIGILYLWFVGFSGILGTTMSMIIRAELQSIGNAHFEGNHQLYNVIVTGYAFLMIFFMLMPVLIGVFTNICISTVFSIGKIISNFSAFGLKLFICYYWNYKWFQFLINLIYFLFGIFLRNYEIIINNLFFFTHLNQDIFFVFNMEHPTVWDLFSYNSTRSWEKYFKDLYNGSCYFTQKTWDSFFWISNNNLSTVTNKQVPFIDPALDRSIRQEMDKLFSKTEVDLIVETASYDLNLINKSLDLKAEAVDTMERHKRTELFLSPKIEQSPLINNSFSAASNKAKELNMVKDITSRAFDGCVDGLCKAFKSATFNSLSLEEQESIEMNQAKIRVNHSKNMSNYFSKIAKQNVQDQNDVIAKYEDLKNTRHLKELEISKKKIASLK